MRKIILSIWVLFFGACGYMPTSKIVGNIFGERIYVNVEISQQDPRNSVFIIDSIREIVLNKFNKKIVSKNEADTIINVRTNSLVFIPLIYDENGYVVNYKAKLILEFEIIYQDGTKDFVQTSGSYDFAILPNSIISDTARFEAIKNASSEAFDEFVSIMAIKGQINAKHQ
ncbi:LPS assembly lipoprotein LptE [Campylobacter sp. US33a]|uniref:LPS assembly lipoprotein LptE n=1 Tax=Campylobacter sp. CCS1377 TaxID=3158229 RepID=A0AAU7E8L6_9BACT|nr:LPS assembly lipoprotein LptE [Campylobacter sp. US33a]MCW1359749.1 LPS assembly lipoprotein LptE [Campylobacter jejuni]TEY04580.1 hypothetical protein ELQ16_00705 [Campylobacter sp. US33a]